MKIDRVIFTSSWGFLMRIKRRFITMSVYFDEKNSAVERIYRGYAWCLPGSLLLRLGFLFFTHEGLAGADLAAIANEAAISAARRGSMRIVQDDLLVRSRGTLLRRIFFRRCQRNLPSPGDEVNPSPLKKILLYRMSTESS